MVFLTKSFLLPNATIENVMMCINESWHVCHLHPCFHLNIYLEYFLLCLPAYFVILIFPFHFSYIRSVFILSWYSSILFTIIKIHPPEGISLLINFKPICTLPIIKSALFIKRSEFYYVFRCFTHLLLFIDLEQFITFLIYVLFMCVFSTKFYKKLLW